MMTVPEKNIIAWDNGAGGAANVTASYSGGTWFTIRAPHNAVIFNMLLASTAAPTSISAQLLMSPDGGTTVYGPLDVENSKSGGVSERQDGEFQHVSTADGNHVLTIDGLAQGMSYKLQLKATGGTAPTALVKGFLATI